MTARGFYTLLFGLLMLLTALSVGSPGAFLLGCAALIALALSLVCVLCAFFSFRLRQEIAAPQCSRGETCLFSLSVRLFSPLPVAPLSLQVTLPSGRRSEFMLSARMIGETASDNEFPCPHAGVFPVGAVQVTLSDCFALFSLKKSIRTPASALTVLPVPRKTQPILYSPGEGESSAAQRAMSDRTIPEDTRAWQEGDELKRVHWKLSMRRQSLMVHTYETPQRPDALVLLDCAAPQASPARRASVLDALEETCAGVLKSLLDQNRLVRLPLSGERPRELSGSSAEALAPMLKALAQERFAHNADFSRVLMLSSRRMRRTGSTVILTTRLTPSVADTVIALGRMGPHTRLTLVTDGPMTDVQEQLMHLLYASGIETSHVSI